MLSNIGGSVSEMGAVSLYVYNSLVLCEDRDAADSFHRISIVEMKHLGIFGSLARMLGADPRLWCLRGNRMQYWNPAYNSYFSTRERAIKNALDGELRAIEKYSQQARKISDAYIAQMLERIIMDEQAHVEIFKKLLNG